jgi:hypothetical protein
MRRCKSHYNWTQQYLLPGAALPGVNTTLCQVQVWSQHHSQPQVGECMHRSLRPQGNPLWVDGQCPSHLSTKIMTLHSGLAP